MKALILAGVVFNAVLACAYVWAAVVVLEVPGWVAAVPAVGSFFVVQWVAQKHWPREIRKEAHKEAPTRPRRRYEPRRGK